MSSLSHVLSSPRQHSFVPDGGPAKLTFGLSAPQKVTTSFRTAAWLLYSNRAPIFMAPCGGEAMQNYFALTLAAVYSSRREICYRIVPTAP